MQNSVADIEELVVSFYTGEKNKSREHGWVAKSGDWPRFQFINKISIIKSTLCRANGSF